MTTYALKIPADVEQPVEAIDIDPDRPMLEQVKVALRDAIHLCYEIDLCNTLAHWPIPDALLAVDEYGALDLGDRPQLPVNVRAWSMYGRSPLFGDAVLFMDTMDRGLPGPMHREPYDAFLVKFISAATMAASMLEMGRTAGLNVEDLQDRLISWRASI